MRATCKELSHPISGVYINQELEMAGKRVGAEAQAGVLSKGQSLKSNQARRQARLYDAVEWRSKCWYLVGIVYAPDPSVMVSRDGYLPGTLIPPRVWREACWNRKAGRWIVGSRPRIAKTIDQDGALRCGGRHE